MRYFIKKCLLCGCEYGRIPISQDYGKEFKTLEGKDIYSHGYCDKCIDKIGDNGEVKKTVDKK